MARHAKASTPHADAEAGSPSAAPAAPQPAQAALDASRTLTTECLGLIQSMVSRLAQTQQTRAHTLLSWTRLLQAAAHEAEQADDAQALMAVNFKLLNAQWSLAMEHLGSGASQWVQTQAQLADQLRSAGTVMAQALSPAPLMMPGAAAPSASGNGHEDSTADPRALLGQLQEQWLASTQKWIDMAKATAH